MTYDPCKFRGKFTDLIPAGFEFQKLHLNNYRQYSYKIDINNYIRVWQANGGTVEVLGMSTTATKHLYSLIKHGGLEQFKYHFHHSIGGGFCYRWVINNHTQEIELFDREKHCDMGARFTLQDLEYDEKYVRLVIDQIYETYSKRNYSPECMGAVMMMVENGFVIP